jgi:phage tail-like protein
MAFHAWAGLVWNYGSALGSEVSLANFRKNIYLEFYNEAGQLVMAYKIYRCWVSEYQAMPDLDANGNAIAIEHIKIETEGWERDTSVTEPAEPTLSTVAT